MIARTWHGRVPAAKADSYYEYLLRTGVPDYQATPGNRWVVVQRRLEGTVAHFVLTTFWDSIDSIKRFAGDQYERARYYPADDEYLLERETYAVHADVLMLATILNIKDDVATIVFARRVPAGAARARRLAVTADHVQPNQVNTAESRTLRPSMRTPRLACVNDFTIARRPAVATVGDAAGGAARPPQEMRVVLNSSHG